MKITRRPTHFDAKSGTALTIGNFDGVHVGHAALFHEVVHAAKAEGLTPTVVTFSPHPREYFDHTFQLKRITNLRDRLNAMQECGIEQVCILPFDQTIATLAPDVFVNKVLIQQLNAKQVWVGDDFRFGAKRAGDTALLQALGQEYGFAVNDLPEVQIDNTRVSSSQIRRALSSGHIEQASMMLGRQLTYSGNIIHGKKLGRTLGFPTMNLKIKGRASALSGILAVWAHGLSEHPLPAVASLGVRPTVESSSDILLETFIPEWSGNAYGKQVTIEVMAHLRPEMHFDHLDTLVTQMHKDTAQALAILKNKPSRYYS